jgi:hypothetical protein
MPLDEYLRATRDHYAAYHNHKEQMAYGATTLYLAVLTAIALKPGTLWAPPVSKIFFIKFILAVAVIGYLFVGWQLRKREYAADLVRACGDLLARTVSSSLKDPDLTPMRHGEHEFPSIVVSQLRTLDQERGLFDGPRFSEGLTYFVMLCWTIGTLIRVGHAA